jgi:thioredoxin reductase (NADPH)
MNETLLLALYLTPFGLIFGLYVRGHRLQRERNLMAREEALEAGLTEPPSLHPVIDPLRCVGCAACVNACPEMPGHQVLGLLRGKAQLISPTDCIGHGACREACPVDAITLVFGTERRGMEIPHVRPDFQTNVPGIFIAGELGGMGLIRNAIEQGRQAVDSIRSTGRSKDAELLDVLIVGAGPAGFSASLAAMEHGLRFATVEQDSLGGTIAHFPRGKLVMTAPATLPIVGNFRFRETTKERLVEYLAKVEKDTGLPINYGERVEDIAPEPGGFVVTTTTAHYRCKNVLLAIGRRGTPRKLNVPGEELPKVTYRLIDPDQYAGQQVLVVGGGDSALEAAWSIAETPDSQVTLSYRSEAFSRAKKKNREKLEAAVAAGRLRVLTKSQVAEIDVQHVDLVHEDRVHRIPNDTVIVNAGGILPNDFLRRIGIQVETKYGTA